MSVLSSLLSLTINVAFLIYHCLYTSPSVISSEAFLEQESLRHSFMLPHLLFLPVKLHLSLWHTVCPLIMTPRPHSLWLCCSSWFLIKFILQLSSLFDLHLLIVISVSGRSDYFCFDFASHLIWLLHLQVPFSWLPPPHLVYDNAPTCDWLLNQADFFDVFFLTLISY